MSSISHPSSDAATRANGHGVSQRDAFVVWMRIALLSFGGPAGQIATMHRILIDEKRWISERRFLHALNYCMLLPGPEAQQLATYIGWLMHGTRGGLIAGGLFILPGVVAIMALSMIYASFGQVGFVAALFFGLKAAVLAIVLQAVARIGGKALKSTAMRALAAAAFVAIFLFDVPFPLIVLGAGLIGLVGARAGIGGFVAAPLRADDADDSLLGEGGAAQPHPSTAETLRVALVWLLLWLLPVAALLIARGPHDVFSQIAVFFSKMAMVTFGGAYAALAYVAQQAVDGYGWLTPKEMLDGLGMAETTPGPLIMVLQFVGYIAAFRAPGGLPPILAGVFGGFIATWVTFAPCFLWIFLGAPFVERLRGNRAWSGALAAITAAVVGVILNLAIWFAIHAMFREVRPWRGLGLSVDVPVWTSLDPWAAALAAGAIFAVVWLRVGVAPLLGVTALAGLLLHQVGLLG